MQVSHSIGCSKIGLSPAEREALRAEYASDQRVLRLLNQLEYVESQLLARTARTEEMEARLTRRPSFDQEPQR